MGWFKRGKRRACIAIAGLLFVLVFIVWVPLSARAYEGLPEVSIATTPTVDITATMTVLQEDKLRQEIQQLKYQNEQDLLAWLRANASIIFSTLVVVSGGLFGLWRWSVDRRDAQNRESKDRQEAQDKELQDRKAERERRDEEQKRWLKGQEAEREKRAEERFQAVVEGLGSERTEAKVGAAIMLRTFLRPDYEEFYSQAFDLAVVHLRLRKADQSIPMQHDTDTPLPLDSFSHALITVFKESYPKARQLLGGGRESKFELPSLDASRICLDGAYLFASDLNNIWMPDASLIDVKLGQAKLHEAYLRRTVFRKTVLWEADLREADIALTDLTKTDIRNADLTKADIRGAKFNEANLTNANLNGASLGIITISGVSSSTANLEEAQYLEGANLRGITGLTREQLLACKAKGALVDEDTMANAPESTNPPQASDKGDDSQLPSATTSQINTSPSSIDGKSNI